MKSLVLVFVLFFSAQTFADTVYDCTVPKGHGYSTNQEFKLINKVSEDGWERTYLKLYRDGFEMLLQDTDEENSYTAQVAFDKVFLFIPDYSLIVEGSEELSDLKFANNGPERAASCKLSN